MPACYGMFHTPERARKRAPKNGPPQKQKKNARYK